MLWPAKEISWEAKGKAKGGKKSQTLLLISSVLKNTAGTVQEPVGTRAKGKGPELAHLGWVPSTVTHCPVWPSTNCSVSLLCLPCLTLRILLVQNVFYCALYIPYHCLAILYLCSATEVCLLDLEGIGIGKSKPVRKTGYLNSPCIFTSSGIIWCSVFHIPNLTYIPFLLLHTPSSLGLHPCLSFSLFFQPMKTPCCLNHLI